MSQANLRANVKDRLLNDLLGSLSETGWRVLITDRYCLSIISSACRIQDLLAKNVTVVELLEKNREPLPQLEAVYFISPTESAVRHILSDLEKKKYLSTHVFFSNVAPKSIVKLLGGSPNSKLIHTCVDFNLDFLAIEASIFNFRQDEDLKNSFFKGGDYEEYSSNLADRLLSFCLTVKELPMIRYNVEKKNRQVSQNVATRLKEKIEDFRKTNATLDFVKSAPKALLLIIDRSVDVLTPIMDDFSYQSLVQNRVGLEKNCIYGNKITKDGKEVIKKVILDESDAVWVKYRSQHIGEAFVGLTKDLKDFAEVNGMTKDKKNMKLEEVGAMIRKLPEYNHIAMHKKLAAQVLELIKKDGVLEIAAQLQDIFLGKDVDGKAPKHTNEKVMELMKRSTISDVEKHILLMAFSVGRDRDFKDKLMEVIKLTDDQKIAVDNINIMRPIGTFVPGKGLSKAFSSKEKLPEVDASLCRGSPLIRDLVEDILKGVLPDKNYKYVDSPPNSWKIETVTQKKTDYKVYVFVIGGLSYAEIHHAYELQAQYGIEVIFGGTSLVSSANYVDKLATVDSGIKKSSLEDVDDDELSI